MLSKQRRQGKRGNILLAMPQARSSIAWNFIPQNSAIAFGGPACRPAVGKADKS
jgi:hypothetical protein